MFLFALFSFFPSLLSAQTPSPATTFYVNDDFGPGTPGWGVDHFAAIQDAVDYADQHQVSPLTISVFPGTYDENVVIEDSLHTFARIIRIISRAGASATFIDGGSNGPTVTVKGLGSTCELNGFTIRNGSGVDYLNNGTYFGGGIFCLNSSLHIKNNTLKLNTADFGAGICCYYDANYPDPGNPKKCAPIIENNTIEQNTASNGGGGICCYAVMDRVVVRDNNINLNTSTSTGGGIYIHGNFHASGKYVSLIQNNTLLNNSVQASAGTGAGIAVDLNGINKIVDNEIRSNTNTYGWGGGIYVGNNSSAWSGMDQEILDRNFLNNNTAAYGGGIYIDRINLAVLTNNAVSGNRATYFGGGIYIATLDSPVTYKQLTNNSVGYNQTTDALNGSGGGIYVAAEALHAVGIANTIVYGNSSAGVNELDYLVVPDVSYSDVEDPNNAGQPFPGSNNIWMNPKFTDWQLHIAPDSPCKDKGNNNAQYIPGSHPDIPAWDYDGEPRIYNGKVDIGSDEVQS